MTWHWAGDLVDVSSSLTFCYVVFPVTKIFCARYSHSVREDLSFKIVFIEHQLPIDPCEGKEQQQVRESGLLRTTVNSL